MLDQHKREFVKSHGFNQFISFDTFMDQALYHNEIGYYMQKRSPFGQQGDFITSPHISPIFGEVISYSLDHDKNKLTNILEIGAGTGHLLKPILDRINLQTFLIEKNQHIKSVQESNLKPHSITWLDSIPKKFQGYLITHEVLDAFPVHRITVKNQKYYEQGFVIDKNYEMKPTLIKASNELQKLCHDSEIPLIDGYCTEISSRIPLWVEAISASIDRSRWVLIDYGYEQADYYHPARSHGTLRSYHSHKEVTDNWSWLGHQDITASVNFDQVLNSSVKNGWKVNFFGQQRDFLIKHQILSVLEKYVDSKEYYEIAQKCKQLLLDPIGSVMKVAILDK